MKHRASLTCVVLVLVMQLVLRSAVPVLAVRAPPVVAVLPALGLSDLAITAVDEPSLAFALPAHFLVAVPETASGQALMSIGPWPSPEHSEGPAAVRASQEVSAAGGVRNIHQYFVPFDDRDLWQLFEGKAFCHNPPGLANFRACGPLVSKVFVTAGADDTAFFYDHWEDGYDEDPLRPGPTTEQGVLDAGATRVFASEIDAALVGQGPPFYYDGGDRITIEGEDANVVRLANASSFSQNGACPGGDESSGWLAAAWEVLEVDDWGTSYQTTVGEDLNYSGGVPDDHDYTGLEVMAAQNGTEVYYNGILTAILNAGETHPVLGANDGPGGAGVESSDDITATAPIQVQMLTGACSEEIVSGHGYTLQPEDVWDHEYWAPVPGFPQRGRPGRAQVDADIYLHNPDTDSAIMVRVESGVLSASLTISPNTTVSVLDETGWGDLAPGNLGTHMSSSAAFWGVAVIDSATSGTGDSDDWDWGYSLIPVSKLSSQLVVGYAPGSPDLADNGNVAFVVAVTDTTIYVDLDQDSLPDPFDMDGDGVVGSSDVWGVPEWDECVSALGIPVQAGQVLRVGDPFDRNLEGARIYTAGLGEHIAAAWGEDPMWADDLDFLDLGYTLLPLGVPRFTKIHDLAVDADGSGDVSPGDTVTYTLLVDNNGMSTMNDVVLLDDLPYTWTQFVVGSLQVTTPPPTDTIAYDDGAGWRTTPSSDARRLRITWPYLGPQQGVTVTFRGWVSATIPASVTLFCNYGTVSSASTYSVTDKTCPTVQRPLLAIAKAVTPTLVSPGGRITYTVVVSNSGEGAALSTVISDVLPDWIDYVPGTLDLTWPVAQVETVTEVVTHTTFFRGFYADDFDRSVTETTAYGGDDSSEPLQWTTDWGEVNDDGDPGSGQVQVRTDGNALSVPAYVWMGAPADVDAGLTRTLDLSLFQSPTLRYYSFGPEGVAGDYSVTANEDTLYLGTYQGDYCIREHDLASFAGQPGVTLGWMASTGMESGDYYRFDHISIHEKVPERISQRVRESLATTIVYSTVRGIDPAGYDPVARTMVFTEGLRLPPGEVLTATFQARVNPNVPVVGSLWLTNTSCVTSTNWLQVLSAPCDDAPVRVQQVADLRIVKSDFPAEYVMPGGILTYTLEYANIGGEDAQGVYITDTLPDEVTYGGVVEQPPGWSDPPSYDPRLPATLTWYTPTLAVDITGTIVYTVTVAPGSLGTITNTVCISTATPETDYDNNCDVEPIVVTDTVPVDVTIAKSDDVDPVAQGGQLVYTLVYANNGPESAENVVVSDTLPPEVTFVAASPTPSSGPPNPLQWSLGTLDVDDTGTIVVTVMVGVDVTETLTNLVHISTTTPEILYDNNDDEEPTDVLLADVTIAKFDDPDPVGRDGKDLVYTLVYTNNGPALAEGVVVTDVLPPEVAFVQAAPAQVSGPNPLAWDLGTLAAGESGTIVVTVTVQSWAGPTFTNTVRIATDSPESDPDNNEDREPTDVIIDVAILKSDQPDFRNPGELLVYTLTYTNTGPFVAQEVYITDDLPNGVTFVRTIKLPRGWYTVTEQPMKLVWYTPTLAADTTGTIVYEVQAADDVPATIENYVRIDTDTPETNYANNEDIEPTPVRLLHFRALPLPGAVLLQWETAWEVDTYGFALLRGASERLEDAAEIAFLPAAGHGEGGGAAYRYVDRRLESGQRYTYWLAEVDTGGRRTVYRPVTVAAFPDSLYRAYLPLIWRLW